MEIIFLYSSVLINGIQTDWDKANVFGDPLIL